MISAVIIDDEEFAIHALKHEIELHFNEINLLGFAQTMREAFHLITELQPDLIFLDIQMDENLSFDLLDTLGNISSKIIFTTAYSKYAIEAIKHNAFDYLLKPIDTEDIRKTLERWKEKNKHESENKTILIKSGNKFESIKIDAIYYIESYGNYSKVWLENKWLISDKTMKQNEVLFQTEDFFRISRYHLVQWNKISQFDLKNKSISLLNNIQLTVSLRKLSLIKKRLDK